ncbi:MAG: hypothetical protein ACE5FO_07510 [Parvularculaceae bacterium]
MIVRDLTIAALSVAAALFATASASERIPAEAGVTAQKSAFLERLVTDSISSRTILDSGDLAAIAKLEEARRLVERAKSLLSDGDYRQANELLNRALELVNTEARRLSVDDVKRKRAEEAFEKRRHTVEIFLSAHERVTENEADSKSVQQAAAIKRLLAEADKMRRASQYEKALAMLDRAYEIARGDIRSARDGKTLVRSLVFETPKEAYEYELGRTRSHFLLLEFALEEKDPSPAQMMGVSERRARANELRDKARAKAETGDYVGAIGDLEAATKELIRGIRMSGFFIPV